MNVYQSYDNFYNELPFAERLLEITKSYTIADTVKNEFVKTVITCYIGSELGYSRNAESEYKQMIRNFSPK